MQQEAKIAAVYANALLELAIERDRSNIIAFSTELQEYSQVLQSDPQLWKFLVSPIIPTENKIELLEKALHGKITQLILHFLLVLIRHNRLDQLAIVQKFFHKEANRFLGKLEVTIYSAYDISQAEEQALKVALQNHFYSEEGKEIILKKLHRPDLIGGLLILVEDKVIDMSIQGRFKRLNKALLHHKIIGEEFYED